MTTTSWKARGTVRTMASWTSERDEDDAIQMVRRMPKGKSAAAAVMEGAVRGGD
jgi:hypothetical protein